MRNKASKTLLLLLLLPIGLLLSSRHNRSVGVVTPQSIPDPCATENAVFQDGEKIVYKLFYNWNFVWLAAGEVTFSVHDTGGEFHVAVRGRTYSSYEWFYKVRDNY
ncbi:MAG: DUF3108 domain-containing protein, partial [Bacteroidota bacterium]